MNYSFTLLALAAAGAVVFAWRSQVSHRGAVGRQRRAMWSHCDSLLEDSRISQEDIDYPALHGLYKGHRVVLEAIADHVGYRKLPQLWLRASLYTKLPVAGVMDYLVRPENIEFYSPIWSLPVSAEIPAGWPQHALLRLSDDDAMPDPGALAPHMQLFEQPQAKELVITPSGLRVVYQLAQGERAYYAVFRSLRFDKLPVAPEPIAALLDRMLAIATDLQSGLATDRSPRRISAIGS